MEKEIKKTADLRLDLYTNSNISLRQTPEGEESGRTIEGYAILFDTPSVVLYENGKEEMREIIDRGAITRELLDSSDILFTMFHDRHKILGRSKNGKGTLSYDIDDQGVKFSLTLPETTDGNDALALVREGIIDGCSFAFSTKYYDKDYVDRSMERKGDKMVITSRVKVITGIYDMTITPNPAYAKTSVEARERNKDLFLPQEPETKKDLRGYIREMRENARIRF